MLLSVNLLVKTLLQFSFEIFPSVKSLDISFQADPLLSADNIANEIVTGIEQRNIPYIEDLDEEDDENVRDEDSDVNSDDRSAQDEDGCEPAIAVVSFSQF